MELLTGILLTIDIVMVTIGVSLALIMIVDKD
jgi:hypothetical protein